MATFLPWSERAGDAQREWRIQSSDDRQSNNLLERSAASNTYVPSLLQPAQPLDIVLEGHTFFKADALPGEQARWTRVERSPMLRSQSKLYEMMREGAFEVSAAEQYLRLGETLRAQITQLIHDRKVNFPDALWSCVYAKEHERSSKARNAGEHDRETVAMDVILMRRPLNTGPYPTSPMGDVVDLTVPNLWHRNTKSSHTYTEADASESQSSSYGEEEDRIMEA